uniref:C-type lectin domain-containing protein n=1 Tax=Gopherus evgoodei TaxID=1825980 RepID=A0A8C4XZY2_9SAUR
MGQGHISGSRASPLLWPRAPGDLNLHLGPCHPFTPTKICWCPSVRTHSLLLSQPWALLTPQLSQRPSLLTHSPCEPSPGIPPSHSSTGAPLSGPTAPSSSNSGFSLSPPGCRLCAPNWLLHGDKCYWLSKESKKWNESREDCSAKSSQMLMSQDQREMAFIKTITEGKYSIWIGLHLTTSKGNWTWVDGSLLESPCNLIIVAVRGAKCKALLGWLAKVTFTPGGTR